MANDKTITEKDIQSDIAISTHGKVVAAMPEKQEESNVQQDTSVTDLVILQNNQALTTSLKVAEVFGKRHDHVVRDIRAVAEQIEDAPKFGEMFVEAEYADKYGRMKPMYYMNRDGFTLLAMGFTGAKALQFKMAYIDAFNKMEEALKAQQKPMTPAEMLYAAAGQLLDHEHKLTQHDQQISELLVNQAALVTYNMRNIVGLKSVNKDQQRQLDKHEEDISTIKQAFNAEVSLREEIKTIVEIAVHAQNMKHQDAYNIVYNEIQKELGINLASRVNNIKKRLQKSGASKSKIEAVSKLDAIEQDPSLYKPIRKILAFLREAAAT